MKKSYIFLIAILFAGCFESHAQKAFSALEKSKKETKTVKLFNDKVETIKVELSPKRDNKKVEENKKVNLNIDLKWIESENTITFSFKNQTQNTTLYLFEMGTSDYKKLKGSLEKNLIATKQIKKNPILTFISFKDISEKDYKGVIHTSKKDKPVDYTKKHDKIRTGDKITAYITLYVATEMPKNKKTKLCYEAKTIELEITLADGCELNFSRLENYYQKLNNSSRHYQITQKIWQLDELVEEFNKQNDSYKCANCEKERNKCVVLRNEIEELISYLDNRIDNYVISDISSCMNNYKNQTGNDIRYTLTTERNKLSDHRQNLEKIKLNFCDVWYSKTEALKKALTEASKEIRELSLQKANTKDSDKIAEAEKRYNEIVTQTNTLYSKTLSCIQNKCATEYKNYKVAVTHF